MMRIGVLQAGRAPQEARARRGDYGRMFVDFFAGPGTWNIIDVEHGQFPRRIQDHDAYIITGSKYSAYDDEPWIHRLQELIRELHAARTPVLGFCFGHQTIAQSLGGLVQKNPAGWELGVREIHLTAQGRNYPGLRAAPEPLRILQTHQDIVTRLPPGAVHLARSAQTAIEMYALDDHILCLQGHPESDAEMIRELVRRMQGTLNAREAQEALSSLALTPHTAFLHDWLLNFLVQSAAVAQAPGRAKAT